jgi:hypothetical protein
MLRAGVLPAEGNLSLPPLQVFRLAWREHFADLLNLRIAQTNIQRADVFRQEFQGIAATDRDKPGRLVEQPGQCKLRITATERFRNFTHLVHKRDVSGKVLSGEAGILFPDIPFAQLVQASERARQHAARQRGEGHQRHTHIVANVKQPAFNIACP